MKTVSEEFLEKAREIMDRGEVVFVDDFCKELKTRRYLKLFLRTLFMMNHKEGK